MCGLRPAHAAAASAAASLQHHGEYVCVCVCVCATSPVIAVAVCVTVVPAATNFNTLIEVCLGFVNTDVEGRGISEILGCLSNKPKNESLSFRPRDNESLRIQKHLEKRNILGPAQILGSRFNLHVMTNLTSSYERSDILGCTPSTNSVCSSQWSPLINKASSRSVLTKYHCDSGKRKWQN